MGMSVYESQKFVELENRLDQTESILAGVINELRASKILKEPKK